MACLRRCAMRLVDEAARHAQVEDEMGALLQMNEQVFAAARHSLNALAPDEDTEVLWIRVLQLARQHDGDRLDHAAAQRVIEIPADDLNLW